MRRITLLDSENKNVKRIKLYSIEFTGNVPSGFKPAGDYNNTNSAQYK